MTILASIFTAIKAFLTLVGLWKEAVVAIDEKKVADRDSNRQKLNDAIDKEVDATTEDDFNKAQSEIASHLPRP